MLKYYAKNIPKFRGLYLYGRVWINKHCNSTKNSVCGYLCDYDIKYTEELNKYASYFFNGVADRYNIVKFQNLPITSNQIINNSNNTNSEEKHQK